jgi:hypothetical protein
MPGRTYAGPCCDVFTNLFFLHLHAVSMRVQKITFLSIMTSTHGTQFLSLKCLN